MSTPMRLRPCVYLYTSFRVYARVCVYMCVRCERARRHVRPRAAQRRTVYTYICIHCAPVDDDDEKGRDVRETRGEESESDGSVPEDLRNPLACAALCVYARATILL